MRIYPRVTTVQFYATLALIISLASETTAAEVVPLKLPGEYTDFALNPSTGTIAAVDSAKNTVTFFRRDDLMAPVASPTATGKVGPTPCSVFYKKFGDVGVFAVVCTQDSHMFLFRADEENPKPEDFALLKKINLDASGVTSVMGSINPEDPFLYYCHRDGHDSATGVVSLRDMKNHGLAFNDSMDGAISATGELAYRRRSGSPSGFESLILTSGLKAEKPSFSRLFYDHTSTAEYVPDPLGKMTISGKGVFTATLEKPLGELNFVGAAFFKSPPVIVGFDRNGNPPRPNDKRETFTIKAVSYNTLTTTGISIAVPPSSLANSTDLPRGVAIHADFKRVGKRVRMIADDERDQIIVGDRDQLSIIPLKDMEIADEPLLMAEIKETKSVLVNQPTRLTLEPMDPRVTVTLEDLPAGMSAEGNVMTWTPTDDQLGKVTLSAMLKSQDIQKSISFDLTVSRPSVNLPFTPGGMAISSDNAVAVVWEVPADTRHFVQENPATLGKADFRLAVLDLPSGKTQAERRIAESPRHVVLSETNLFLLPQQGTSAKCEVLNKKTLERVKSLVVSGPIQSLDRFESKIVIATNSEIEIYDADSLKKLDRLTKLDQMQRPAFDAYGRIEQRSPVTADGIDFQGILFNGELKPLLIQSAEPIPVAGKPTSGLAVPNIQGVSGGIPQLDGRSQVASAKIPQTGVQVSLSVSSQQIDVLGAIHTWRTQQEVVIVASGSVDETQVLVRELDYAQTAQGTSPSRPILDVTQDKAYVAYGKSLYTWSIPNAMTMPLRLGRRQTALTLSEGRSTELQHSFTGGKAPVEYSMQFSTEGISIDKNAGSVKLDNELMRSKAIEFLVDPHGFRNSSQPAGGISAVDANTMAMAAHQAKMAVQSIEMKQPIKNSKEDLQQQKADQILGRKPTGVPVMLPIGVMVTDADLNTDQMVYYILVEVPANDLKRKAEELAKEASAKSKMPGSPPQKTINKSGAPPENLPLLSAGQGDGETAELRKKVELLEDRVDLLTRQLNELIKRSDHQNRTGP